MQKYLEGLTALHTSEMQDSGTRALGRPVRRESISTEHPLIRVNPVTGWKSLYYNPGFVTAIVGTSVPSDSRCTALDFAFGLYESPRPDTGRADGPLQFRIVP